MNKNKKEVKQSVLTQYETYVDYIQEIYQERNPNVSKLNIPEHDRIYLEGFARLEKAGVFLYYVPNAQILYATENAEIVCGFPASEIQEKGLLFLFEALSPIHADFPMVSAKWTIDNFATIPLSEWERNLQIVYCGLRFVLKNGETARILTRNIPVEYGENGALILILVSIVNIDHLMKDDFYWARLACGTDEQYKAHYISTNEANEKGDILTKREKEILMLIAKGMETKEIAKSLFISNNTVSNHRKNMILKTGARDSTALVQLCRMCGII